MTKMFGNMSTDGLEVQGDRLGGGGVVDTNYYDAVIKVAYAGKASSSNAQSITYVLDLDGREMRETQWITNRNGDNFYLSKDGKNTKHLLPGAEIIDELCLVTTGLPLSEQDFEEKIVNIYDFDAKKEVPTAVMVPIAIIGKDVGAAIVRQTVDKQKKEGNTYVNTGETRDENVVEKFFHAESGRTVTEIREGIEAPVHKPKWIEKHAGKTRNRAKGAEGKTGAPGSKPAGAPGAAPKTTPSLFG